MAINYTQLKTELTTDPNGLGLTAAYNAGGDQTCAEILNLVRAGAAYEQDDKVVEAHKIVDAIVPAEWSAATAGEKDRIAFIVSAGQVNLASANVRTAFTNAFGAGTTTRANLIALTKRPGSRAEALFGAGTTVSGDDITKARNA